jgi:hypothetical protein
MGLGATMTGVVLPGAHTVTTTATIAAAAAAFTPAGQSRCDECRVGSWVSGPPAEPSACHTHSQHCKVHGGGSAWGGYQLQTLT